MKRCSTSVSRITGTIMTMISTDMYHHCGPRVAFWAATRIGMVCAFAVDRKSASRYSFQERMSTSSVVATRPGLASGSTISKKMRIARGAVELARSPPDPWGSPTKKSYISQTTIGRLTVV